MAISPLAECITQLKEAGIPYTRIAKEAGCHTSTIYRIQHGYIDDPKDSVARKLRELAARHLPAGTKAAA